MQSLMSRSLVQTPVVQQSSSARPSRTAVPVLASAEESTRRTALSFVLTSTAALLVSSAAQAKLKNPAQDSIRRGGSSTEASMSAFDMQGIKKRGIKPAQRKGFLDEVKSKAQELASKATK